MTVVDPETSQSVKGGGTPLRELARREAYRFDQYLRSCGIAEYRDGLSSWESLAVEGYIYQKLRGRIDDSNEAEAGPTD